LRSLGRGFYEFSFAFEDDLRSVWAMGTVNLKPGLLRLFKWTKDFSIYTQRNTHTHVWIRLMALPQEYWMERTLREIASAVGTPLIIDNATTKRVFGHYARILVDMDFTRKLFHEIVVEKEGYSFPVKVVYERMPDYCTHCQTIGHDVSACRWLFPRKDKVGNAAKEIVGQGKKPVQAKRSEWVPLKENPSGIGSSRAFQDPQIVPSPTVVENLENTFVPQQQQTIHDDIPLINITSTKAFLELETNFQATAAAAQPVDEGTAQHTALPPQQGT